MAAQMSPAARARTIESAYVFCSCEHIDVNTNTLAAWLRIEIELFFFVHGAALISVNSLTRRTHDFILFADILVLIEAKKCKYEASLANSSISINRWRK